MQSWLSRKSKDIDNSGRPWILAVSGGADSMAMMHAMHRRFPDRLMIVAHMNHHAREGSDADESFVRVGAAGLGLGFECGHWRPERSSHFEADARTARHEWLAQIATNFNASAVMTAHTRDDQVETVLMRLARGAGPWGLGGIRPCRKLPGGAADLVRPMLEISRDEVLAYLESLGVGFRDDPTNADVANQTRAWIRHVIVPQFTQRLNPRFRDAVGQLAELQAEEQAGLDALVHRKSEKLGVVAFESGVMRLSLRGYRSFGPAWLRRRLLRMIWTDHGLPQRSMSHDRWVEIDRHISRSVRRGTTGRYPLPGRMTLEITSTEALIFAVDHDSERASQIVRQSGSAVVELPYPGEVEVGSLRIVLETVREIPSISHMRRIAKRCCALDTAVLEPPLVLRKPLPGDRFDPLGMGGRHQKLTDYLRIRGIKGEAKAEAWLVEDRAGIVWVVGQGVSERAKVRATTESVCMIRIEHGHETRGSS